MLGRGYRFSSLLPGSYDPLPSLIIVHVYTQGWSVYISGTHCMCLYIIQQKGFRYPHTSRQDLDHIPTYI